MATLMNSNTPFINQLLLGKINRVNTDIKQTINTAINEINLSVDQFNVLLILHKLPASRCTLFEMLNTDLMEPDIMLKSIKQLEIAGIIKRVTRKPSDVIEIQLTAKGSKTLNYISNYKELMDSSLEGLNIMEKKMLYHLLGKVQMPVVLETI